MEATPLLYRFLPLIELEWSPYKDRIEVKYANVRFVKAIWLKLKSLHVNPAHATQTG